MALLTKQTNKQTNKQKNSNVRESIMAVYGDQGVSENASPQNASPVCQEALNCPSKNPS